MQKNARKERRRSVSVDCCRKRSCRSRNPPMKNPNVVPIPGSKNKERIIENLDASKVELTEEEFCSLEEALNQCKVYGHRGFNR